jgi:hypothetical protein
MKVSKKVRLGQIELPTVLNSHILSFLNMREVFHYRQISKQGLFKKDDVTSYLKTKKT